MGEVSFLKGGEVADLVDSLMPALIENAQHPDWAARKACI